MSSKMTRQRKWLLGVLGVGVAAVVVDRALLGGPDEASASDEVETVVASVPAASEGLAPAVEPEPVIQAPAAGPIDLSAFARRLETMPPAVDHGSARVDGFEPPADWVAASEAIGAVTEPQQPTSELSRAFSASHTLNATIHDGGAAIAVLDGKVLAVGDEVDGFVLRRVSNRMTVWQAKETGEWVVLREVVSAGE